MRHWPIRAILVITVVALTSFKVHSQSISASPYSVYGVGVLKDKTSSLNRSLSGTGIGIYDSVNLNNTNPASYVAINTTTQIFEMGLFVESDHYQTSQNSSKFKTGNITSLNCWLKFSKIWAGTFGLAPFSTVNYNVNADRKIGVEEGSTVQYSGTGGITQFYFGNGFKVTKNLSAGINASYIFGSLEKNELITSGIGSGTTLKNKISANRLNLDYGVLYNINLKKNRSLSLGVTYNDRLRMNTSGKTIVLGSSSTDTLSSDKKNIEDYILPRKLGTGISFQTLRSTISADFTFRDWANARLEKNIKLRDTKRFSLAYQYKGNPNGEKYIDFIQLRSGFYVQDNYLVLENNPFSEWGFSLGVGLPVRGNLGLINFSYHYNETGTTSNNLIKQQAHVFVLDFTFRDLWGIRRRLD